MIAVQEKVLKPLIFICLKIVPGMPLAKDESKERSRNASPINRIPTRTVKEKIEMLIIQGSSVENGLVQGTCMVEFLS